MCWCSPATVKASSCAPTRYARPPPQRAAKATGKLATRLSKGEKRHRKRLAGLGTVYDATPAARGPTDILAADILLAGEQDRAAIAPGPVISPGESRNGRRTLDPAKPEFE